MLGEDLTRFRDVSKELYAFLRAFAWSDRAERLGLDEVFLDVSDVIAFNVELLNWNCLETSFFHLDRRDPTLGFAFDASTIPHHSLPANTPPSLLEIAPCNPDHHLWTRLTLASHLAHHIRTQLEVQTGYSATVGISTNKLLAKLVGNVNKPHAQTVLLPPYTGSLEARSATVFLDAHDLARIPGIGYKTAQRLCTAILGRPPSSNLAEELADTDLKDGDMNDNHHIKDAPATVRTIRTHPSASSASFARILDISGAPRSLGPRIWSLLHGVDNEPVAVARPLPTQISIEDTYRGLTNLDDVIRSLTALTASLVRRMRVDLVGGVDHEKREQNEQSGGKVTEEERKEIEEKQESEKNFHSRSGSPARRRWLSRPRTLRLTTRLSHSSTMSITATTNVSSTSSTSSPWARSSISTPLPSFVFDLQESPEMLAERLVAKEVLRLFKTVYPREGWSINLLNVAVVGLDSGERQGQDIGRMLKRREDSNEEHDVSGSHNSGGGMKRATGDETDNGQTGGQVIDGYAGQQVAGEGRTTRAVNTSFTSATDAAPLPLQQTVDGPSHKRKRSVSIYSSTPRPSSSGSPPQPNAGDAKVAYRSRVKPKLKTESEQESESWSEQGLDSESEQEMESEQEIEEQMDGGPCRLCGARMPSFARLAHARFHGEGD